MSVYECFDHILPHTSLLRENQIYCGKILARTLSVPKKRKMGYMVFEMVSATLFELKTYIEISLLEIS